MIHAPNSGEWHAERLTGIGASDMVNLFDLPSPYSTIPGAGGCQRRLWFEKSGIAPDFPRIVKPSMQRGTDCEEIVVRKLRELGWRTRRRGIQRDPQSPLFAHVDREARCDLRGGRGALECKTMNGHVAKKVARVGLNDGYLLQMQAILRVGRARYTWGAFAVMDMDAWALIDPIFIEHDEEVQAKIVNLAADLWDHVKAGVPPPLKRHPDVDPVCQECQWRLKCPQTT